MRKGDVWSLKVKDKDKDGLHPLVIITEIKDAETIEMIPLFSGDENATHMDRLLYPYQDWLMGDDWVAISMKTAIPSSNLRSYLNTVPEIIMNEIEKALSKEECRLPKGVLLIEGLGDERESFREELTYLINLASEQQLKEIIIKRIKSGWEALNAKVEETLLDFSVVGLIPSRGEHKNEEKNLFTSLSIKADNIDVVFSIKTVAGRSRIMNVNGEINSVYVLSKEEQIHFKKIGGIWIPDRPVFLDKIKGIIIDQKIVIKLGL